VYGLSIVLIKVEERYTIVCLCILLMLNYVVTYSLFNVIYKIDLIKYMLSKLF